jgi:hypothetical protein
MREAIPTAGETGLTRSEPAPTWCWAVGEVYPTKSDQKRFQVKGFRVPKKLEIGLNQGKSNQKAEDESDSLNPSKSNQIRPKL